MKILLFNFEIFFQLVFGNRKRHVIKLGGFDRNKGITRTCLDCGKLVFGGPIRCNRCRGKYDSKNL